MNKLQKILWTIFSYAPLILVCGVAVLIDSLTIKQITEQIWIGIVTIVFGLACIPFCYGLLVLAQRKLPKAKLAVNTASPRDTSSLSSMIAYLLPLVTLSIADVNLWALCAMVVLIVIMLLWTKAIFVNPIVYLFGYRYYAIQVPSGMSYTLLSKQKRFNPKSVGVVIELFDEIYLEV